MSLPEVLGLAYALVTALVVAFQVALALGAPWGRYAMGGAFPGRMPTPLRIAALAQGIALAALAMMVLAAAGLADVALVDEWPGLIWMPVAVSGVRGGAQRLDEEPGRAPHLAAGGDAPADLRTWRCARLADQSRDFVVEMSISLPAASASVHHAGA